MVFYAVGDTFPTGIVTKQTKQTRQRGKKYSWDDLFLLWTLTGLVETEQNWQFILKKIKAHLALC